jgi:hypothetical protein
MQAEYARVAFFRSRERGVPRRRFPPLGQPIQLWDTASPALERAWPEASIAHRPRPSSPVSCATSAASRLPCAITVSTFTCVWAGAAVSALGEPLKLADTDRRR